MTERWRWAGARSTGTSHLRTGIPCQDFGCAESFDTADGTVLIAVVADGAGSASHANLGSKLTCISVLRSCREFLGRHSVTEFDEETGWEWIDAVREAINHTAGRNGLRPRDLASTLVTVILSRAGVIVLHVGDGAVVIKRAGSADWEVASWPFHGEYASTTAFVTDDPQPNLRIVTIHGEISDFALFSDGIERLVLDHTAKTAHSPFFERMLHPLRASNESGQIGSLSLALRAYLDGEAVCQRTDDDKTLILGARG